MEKKIWRLIEFSKENKYQMFLNEYRRKKFKVILFGAGQASLRYIEIFKRENIEIDCIIDNDIKKQEISFCGIEVLSLKNAINKYKNYDFRIVISTPNFEEEIRLELAKYISSNKIDSFECQVYCLEFSDYKTYRNYLEENIDEISELYNHLEDDKSKRTLLGVIEGRLTAEIKCFRDIYEGDQYFPQNIIKLSKDEVILDVGAFDGDTLEEIVSRTKGIFNKIYCFEPEKNNIEKLEQAKNRLRCSNIEIIKKGAWHCNEKILFESESEAFKLYNDKKIYENYDNMNNYIEVDSIDNLIEDKVTFLKMDIEGSELQALKGAKKTIKEYTPKLAICVYHKDTDILDISKYIRSLVPSYKLYLRHHTCCGTDTVLYAINEI